MALHESIPEELERIAADVVDLSLAIHKGLGPGLLESVYEAVLAKKLTLKGYRVDIQKPISFEYEELYLSWAFEPIS